MQFTGYLINALKLLKHDVTFPHRRYAFLICWQRRLWSTTSGGSCQQLKLPKKVQNKLRSRFRGYWVAFCVRAVHSALKCSRRQPHQVILTSCSSSHVSSFSHAQHSPGSRRKTNSSSKTVWVSSASTHTKVRVCGGWWFVYSSVTAAPGYASSFNDGVKFLRLCCRLVTVAASFLAASFYALKSSRKDCAEME